MRARPAAPPELGPPNAKQAKAVAPATARRTAHGVAEDEASATSVEQATNLIRQAIVQGRYGPGERIKISETAERFGVSAMPVREALRKLEGEGIVSITPNRGATVRPFDEKFIEDMYEVRSTLQIMILARTIEVLTLAKLKGLENLIAKHRLAVDADDANGTLQTARVFFTTLFEMGGNREAERLFQRGWDMILALRLRFGYSRERLDHMAIEFQQLIDALRRRDARDAERVIRMHNRAGMEDLVQKIGHTKLSPASNQDPPL